MEGVDAIAVPATPEEVRPIDKIRAAFADKFWELYVPEWDLTIYFRPMTQADLQAAELARGSELGRFEKNVNLLVRKARNKDGMPLFQPGDCHALMNEARFEVVQRCINFMYSCGSLSLQEAKIELGNAQSSATTSSSPTS